MVTDMPLAFHARVDSLKKMKEEKVAKTVAGENDDLCPLVEIIRNGRPVCTVIAPQVDRDMGLHAVQVGCEVFEASEVWMMTDAHQSNSKTDAHGQPWGPDNKMQNACDNEGACDLGLITDCLMVFGRERGGDETEYMFTIPYHVHKQERTVRWVEDQVELIRPEGDKKLQGFIPEVFREVFSNDTVQTTMFNRDLPEEFSYLANEIRTMPDDVRLANIDIAGMLLLSTEGFVVMGYEPESEAAKELFHARFRS